MSVFATAKKGLFNQVSSMMLMMKMLLMTDMYIYYSCDNGTITEHLHKSMLVAART